MKDVFQEYGVLIIKLIAILSLIAMIVTAMTVTAMGEDGVLGIVLKEAIRGFVEVIQNSF